MPNNSDLLAAAVAGAVTGALVETVNELAKEVRRYAGSGFDEYFDALKARTVRSVENAPFDGIPEDMQLLIVEQTRSLVSAILNDAGTPP